MLVGAPASEDEEDSVWVAELAAREAELEAPATALVIAAEAPEACEEIAPAMLERALEASAAASPVAVAATLWALSIRAEREA